MARFRGSQAQLTFGALRLSRSGLLRSTALQAAALVVLTGPLHAQPAPNARPTGGSVVAGQASIAATASTTTITQSTNRAAIDWQSFNIGQNQAVVFKQPATSAVTLNRVIGPDPSAIAGRISANGQVVLVNPSGVVFTGSAQVDVGGLVVSTANITNQNFMSGVMKFDTPGKPDARIVNQGVITVQDTGLAALVAPSVSNSGTIIAKMGRVALAAGTKSTIDLYGDGLVALDVTGKVTQAPTGPDGLKTDALVTNTGTILAQGGTVALSAVAADGLVQDLVRAGGVINVGNAKGAGGTVTLAGVGGGMTITGDIAANGATGGQIEAVTTGTVALASTARISASGRNAGGAIAIGTTLARAKAGPSVTPTATAAGVKIAAGAKIAANAGKTGNGGTVTILSTRNTDVAGTISAKGGRTSGNGGAVEVSGNTGYSLTGQIDVGAAHGTPGTILIDPDTLNIVSTLVNTTSGTNVAGTTLTNTTPANGAADILNTTVAGFTGTVILSANTALNVQAPVTSATVTTLTLQGTGTSSAVTINAPITLSSAGSTVTLSAGTGGVNIFSTVNAGTISASTTGAIQLGDNTKTAGPPANPGNPGILSATSTIALTTDTLTTGNAGGTLSAPSGLVQIAPNTAGRTINLGPAAAGTLSVDTATLTLQSSTLRLGNSAASSPIAITAATDLSGGAATTLDLQTTGAVTQTGSLKVDTLTGSAGTITLNTTTNALSTINNLSATTSIALKNTSSSLTIAGATGLQSGAAGAAGTLSLTQNGSLIVNSAIAAGGAASDVTITQQTAGATTIGTTGTIWSTTGTVGLTARGTLTQSGGLIGANTANITATAYALSGGTLATTGDTTLTANLADTGGLIAVGGKIASGSGGPFTNTLNGGTIQAGTIALSNPLAVTAGTIATASDLAVSLTGTQTATTAISAAGNLTINSGTGTAGTVGSKGTSSVGLTIAGATLGATGNTTIWIDDSKSLAISSGTVAAGNAGTLAISAGTLSQSGGTLSGQNVRLIATQGTAAQSGGTTEGASVWVQAPNGTNNFAATLSNTTVSASSTTLNITGPTRPDATVLSFKDDVPATALSYTAPAGTPTDLRLTGTTITVDKPITTGTLGLIASAGIIDTAAGAITAGTLYGASGGGLDLSLGSHAIGKIGPTSPISFNGTAYAGLTATGTAKLTNTSPTLTTQGSIGLQAGSAGGAGNVVLTQNGSLIIASPIAAMGTGNVTIAQQTAGTTQITTGAQLWANNGTVTLGALGAIDHNAGVIGGKAAAITATAYAISGTGTLATTGNTTLTGNLADTGGLIAVQGTLLSGAGGPYTNTLNGGTIQAGSAQLNTPIVITTGRLVSADDVAIALSGAYAGTVTTAGNLTINTGTGTAGTIGSQGNAAATSLALNAGGTLAALGNVRIWLADTASLTVAGGTIAAGGTLGVTAGTIAQSSGVMWGNTVRLLATTGDATQSGGTLAGTHVAVQAPAGTASFGVTQGPGTIGATTTLTINGPTLLAGGTLSLTDIVPTLNFTVGTPSGTDADTTLIGSTIALTSPITTTTTGTVALYAQTNITESAPGLVTTGTLTGSAGVPSATWTLPAGLAALATNQATLGWTAATTGNATLGTIDSVTGGAGTISLRNAIGTLSDFATTGSLSLTDAATATYPTLSVAGAISSAADTTIAVAGPLSVPGTITATTGNVLLVANALSGTAGDPTGTLTLAGTIAATAGTIGLYAQTNILESSGTLQAATLTARAGGVAGDTDLPTTWQVASQGSMTLTGSNAITTLGTLQATGAIALTDTPAAGTLTLAGPVVAAYGSAIANDLSIDTTGALTVNGAAASAAGNVTLHATGTLTVAGASTDISAPGLAALRSDTAYVQPSGLINAGAITVNAPAQTISGTAQLISTGSASADGIVFSGGTTGLSGGTIASAGASGKADLGFLGLTQSGGIVSAAGNIAITNRLSQSAGTIAAVGSLSAGSLGQSGGLANAAAITIGTGTGAGFAGSTATAGTVSQTAGTLSAAGTIALYGSTGSIELDGVVSAGSLLAATSANGFALAGQLGGNQGVALYSQAGNATQSAGTIAASATAGKGILIQAPAGTLSVTSFGTTTAATSGTSPGAYTLYAPATQIPSAAAATPASFTPVTPGTAGTITSAKAPVALIADSILIPNPLLASTLALYARSAITETTGTILTADLLTGSIGVPAAWTLPTALTKLGWTQSSLGWTATTGTATLGSIDGATAGNTGTITNRNTIATLGQFDATGPLSLTTAGTLSLAAATADLPVNPTSSTTVALTGTVASTGNATLAVAGPLTVAASGALLATGTANATLIATQYAGTVADTTAGTLTIAGAVSAGGTLGLYSETAIAAPTGSITAATLTGRAGFLAADTNLPTAWTHDTTGSIDLTGTNAIATLSTLAATGSITLADATPTLTLAGPIVAGYGPAAASGPLAISNTGNILITGQVASGNANATIAAGPTLTVQGTAVVSAPDANTLTLTASTLYAQTAGLVNAGALIFNAPTQSFTGTAQAASSGKAGTTGIALQGNLTTIDTGATLVAASSTPISGAGGNGTLTLVNLTQTGGTLSAIGSLAATGTIAVSGGLLSSTGAMSLQGVTLSGGTISAAGSLAMAALAQSNASTLLGGSDLVIGAGTGTAGRAGSVATSTGGFSQAASGTLAARNLTIWSNGPSTLDGTITAGGTLAITSNGAIASAGTLTGSTGVALLAVSGNATQNPGGLVAAGTLTGQGALIQAPTGNTNFTQFKALATSVATPTTIVTASVTNNGTYTLRQAATQVPFGADTLPATLPVAGASLGTISYIPGVPVALIADSITIDRTLTAGGLALYAHTSIAETGPGLLNVAALTGSAGVPAGWTPAAPLADLGWTAATLPTWTTAPGSVTLPAANTVGLLADFATNGNFSLTTQGALAAGPSPALYNLPLYGTAIALGGTLSSTGTIALSAGGALSAGASGTATWAAPSFNITAGAGITLNSMSIATASGGFLRPISGLPATDPWPSSHAGASFTALSGDIRQNGVLTLSGYAGAPNPLIRFVLPANAANTLTLNNLAAQAAGGDVMLNIGASGTASGTLDARNLAVFYSGTSSGLRVSLNGSLLTASGQRITGDTAAGLASIGFYPNGSPPAIYQPSQFLRFNTCPITSVNCVLLSRETIPVRNPTRDLPPIPIFDIFSDPDFILPNISDLDS